jgi:hypothetical protein
LDDAEHVKDIKTKDYSVNEIKTKADAADASRVYEKAELKRIVANAEQIGDVKVWRGKEAEQFLNHNGANAMYLPGEAGQSGALVLRESASSNMIIEELLHLEQHRILGFRELSTADILRLENEAQEALLKYAKASNWTDDEIKLIEENQQYWKSKSEEFRVNPEAVEKELNGLMNIYEIRKKWPWAKTKLSAKELMAGGGNCKEWAKKLQEAIGGDIIYIKDKFGAPGIGDVYTKNGILITEKPWLEHFAVRKDGIYYDRITGPEGMNLDQYQNLFKEAKYLDFETIINY